MKSQTHLSFKKIDNGILLFDFWKMINESMNVCNLMLPYYCIRFVFTEQNSEKRIQPMSSVSHSKALLFICQRHQISVTIFLVVSVGNLFRVNC